MRNTAAAKKADGFSGRPGKTVTGIPHNIGNGFTARHFSEEMFGGDMDPLLMVDHFVMTAPTFAPHLHAGISAVTVLFEDSEGAFLNRDTLGYNIALQAGDLYWLAAASGAAHEERPDEGARVHALQIFVNLPAILKKEPARALHVRAGEVPVIEGQGHRVRVLLGRSGDSAGAQGTPEEMTMLDGFLRENARFVHVLPEERQGWIYAVSGRLTIRCAGEERVLEAGSSTTIAAGPETEIVLESVEPAHFVLMAAKPIREAFIKHGPLVMSTAEDIRQTLARYAKDGFGRIPSAEDKTTTVRIGADERARESALRERFANFWASASGDPRAVYDAFIAASPLASGVTLEHVDEEGMQGWWVRPEHAEPGQAILYIHGGGYVLGSAQAYRGFASQIVSRTQVPALVIDYPLAPETTLPAAPAAALAAWRWLRDQGFKRIAIVGDSAGGGLTLVTLAQLTGLSGATSPIAGVAFSPWTDLSFSGRSMTDPAVKDPLIGYEYLQDCARKYCGSMDAADPLASPLLGDLRGLPPILIQVGTDERLLDDARQYADRAAQAGVSVHLEIWEGMHHVFQLDVAHLESSRAALDHAAQFLVNAFNHE